LIVKHAWRDALEKHGLWSGSGYPDVFIKFKKLRNRKSVAHRIRYCFRRPLVDLNEKLKEFNLIDIDYSFVKFLVCYVPRRHNLGWFANFKRLKMIVIKRRAERSVLCPACGHPADFIGFVKPEECVTLPWLWFDRFGCWHEDRPP
jgi:hypothetical protein